MFFVILNAVHQKIGDHMNSGIILVHHGSLHGQVCPCVLVVINVPSHGFPRLRAPCVCVLRVAIP